MKILVTGGTGFVGSHAATRLLEDGHDVRLFARTPDKVAPLMEKMGVDPDRFELVKGDITNPASVAAAVGGCEAVVHAAAVVATDPTMDAAMDETNLAGARNVINAALAEGCDPVVHISSVAALFPFQTDPITADHPVVGNDEAYGRSKAACDLVAREHQEAGRPVIILYPSGIIGPDDWTESINLASVIFWIEKGFPSARNISGIYVDVRDLAAVISASMMPGGGPPRYLTMGAYVTAAEHVALIGEAIGAKPRKVPTPQPVMWLWGRLGDLSRKVGIDMVMTSDGYDYLFHSKPGDNSATTESTGVEFRPLVDTFRDTFRWLHEAGHAKGKNVGVLADE